MAKVASSKPYGSGKRNIVTETDPENQPQNYVSPIRTSPRRKRNNDNDNDNDEMIDKTSVKISEKKTKKSSSSSSIPEPPRFNDPKKKQQKKVSTPQKVKSTSKSPKSSVRRKSALEPIVLNENYINSDKSQEVNLNESEREFVTEKTEKEEENSNEEEAEQEELFDYVESIQQENSPIFEENVAEEDENDYVNYEEIEEPEEIEYIEEPEEENEFNYEEEDEISRSIGAESKDQFKYTSESVRARLAQYFNRFERSSSSVSNDSTLSVITSSSGRSELWNRVKDWISERVIPSALEISEATVEYTKKAIESISKRLESNRNNLNDAKSNDNEVIEDYETLSSSGSNELSSPKIYEIIEDYQDDFPEESEIENESKKVKTMWDYEMYNADSNENEIEPKEEVFIGSKESSYHSLPADQDVTLIFDQSDDKPQSTHVPNFPAKASIINSDILDSRLTEIVLFFAKCTNQTSLPSIYEHLEEFFTLKGENSLNFTEKQLVSGVIRDYLTETPSQASDHNSAPIYEPILMPGESQTPKRIKTLSNSGIRFRAPKFTPEEETRLEELEQARLLQQQKTSSKLTTSLATPSQRSKLQRKLLNPANMVEMMESLPEARGRIGATEKRKSDSVSDAIEDIISQKIKEAKKKEESERLETEKLKARVAELEKETRERTTKEALLQKQLEEQKKELEIERESSKSKIESLKAAAATKPVITNTPALSGFSFGKTEDKVSPFNFGNGIKPSVSIENETAPPAFNFGSPPKLSTPNTKESTPSFNFGSSIPTSTGTTNEPAQSGFKGFSFGGDKVETSAFKAEEKSSTETSINSSASFIPPPKTSSPFATFNFGSSASSKSEAEKVEPKKELSSEVPSIKPTSFGFSFGSAPSEKEPESKKGSFGFNSGASSFNIGGSDSLKVPSNTFGNASIPTSNTTATNFSFGGSETKPATQPSNPTFNFGNKPTETSKPAPSTGNDFNFGSSSLKRSELQTAFGFNAPPSNGYNFGSNSSNPNGTTSNANNPFAALNSATNIFASTSPSTLQTFPSLNSFSFGSSAPETTSNTTNNPFSFPPITSSTAPIIPMNFGGGVNNGTSMSTDPQQQQQQQMDMSFQTGRSISIPRRRRK